MDFYVFLLLMLLKNGWKINLIGSPNSLIGMKFKMVKGILDD